MHTELKKAFEQVCDLFDDIDSKLGIMDKAEAKGKLSNVLRFELLSFMMCLSASDGRISRVEAQLIRDYFELDIYPGHIKDLLKEYNIGKENFYRTIPESLKLAVKIDNLIVSKRPEISKGLSEIVIELFKVFGKEMIVSDEKVSLQEQAVWSKYISMMVQYLVKESAIYKSAQDTIERPGKPIEIKYENSLATIGRIYSLYYGRLN